MMEPLPSIRRDDPNIRTHLHGKVAVRADHKCFYLRQDYIGLLEFLRKGNHDAVRYY